MSIPLPRFGPIFALMFAACSSGIEPSAPLPTTSAPTSARLNEGNGVVIQAMGAGVVDLSAAGAGDADFQFVAKRKADGTVLGHFKSPLALPNGVRTRLGRELIINPTIAQLLRESAAEVLTAYPATRVNGK